MKDRALAWDRQTLSGQCSHTLPTTYQITELGLQIAEVLKVRSCL